MQEKQKDLYAVKFLSVFGEKIVGGEYYNPDDDITDQHAPVNDPEVLYEQFVVPEDIMDELEDENIEDFENDLYPYEDRTEYGVDIAAAAHLDLKGSIERLKSKKKKETQQDLDPVKPDDDEPSVA